MNVDFIFDFASPNAYLCHKAIQNLEKTHDIKFNKPEAKSEVKIIKADELDKLIDLLENEAKVI